MIEDRSLRDQSEDRERPVNAVYRDMGAYIARNRIRCSVMNGVEPVTGEAGRDVDIFVPDPEDAAKLIGVAKQSFTQRGFPWATPMHPIWGPRCIGVRHDDCGEFHISTLLRLGFLDLGGVLTLEAVEGALGLPFDPALMLFKRILKHNRSILHNRPIWEKESHSQFLLEHRASIMNRLEYAWPLLAEFCRVVLDPDSTSTRRRRRQLLLMLMVDSCRRRPMTSAGLMLVHARRKVEKYGAPCAPYVSVLTTEPPERLREELVTRLGHTFMNIEVERHPWSWKARRKLQARQGLAIHVAATADDLDDRAEVVFHLPQADENGEGYERFCVRILDELVVMNTKWQLYYANTL